jgi:pre-mRNA-splicing factor ATP-dependent RNA helicase DHX15/PRP43
MKIERIGILDPEGKKMNPLTGKEYSDNYKNFAKSPDGGGWSNLPMYRNPRFPPEDIVKDIKDHQVLIIEAGTGNGKSVLVPKYALHAIGYKGKVVVTNPKQLPTRGNAEWAALCLDVEIGKEVGYQYKDSRLDNGKPSKTSETNLLFSTDGTVVQVLNGDPSGSDYDIVIVDEAHERNTRIDTILLQMKKALRINKNLKLIVMSATLPGNLFGEYYKEFKLKSINLPAIPNKPVSEHFLENPVPEKKVPDKIAETIVDIVKSKKKGDIIAFVNSLPEAEQICKKLNKLMQGVSKEKLFCVGLSSKTDSKTKELATDATLYRDASGGPYDRKVVIGTELIESSITIKGAIFVIDNGYALKSGYEPNRMEEFLKPGRIAKASAIQRKGRVGRVAPGACYKMYTKEEYENFDDDPVLAIKKERTEGLILDIFRKPEVETLKDALDYINELIEPPPEELLDSGINTLAGLRLISGTNDMSILTETGQKVVLANRAVGGNVQNGVMLVTSYNYKCDYEICALIAILGYKDISVKKLFVPPIPGNKADAKNLQAKKKNFVHDFGDMFTMLKIYMAFYKRVKKMTKNLLKEFCELNYLNYYVLSAIRRDHLKIWRESRFLEDYRDATTKTFDRFSNILFSIISGYYINIAKKMKGGMGGAKYKNWFPKNKSIASIGRDSSLGKKEEYIYYVTLRNSPSGKNFELCNKISKKQIDIINQMFGYEIEFDRRKTIRRKALVPLRPISRNGKRGTKNKARNKIKSVRVKNQKKKSVRVENQKKKSVRFENQKKKSVRVENQKKKSVRVENQKNPK